LRSFQAVLSSAKYALAFVAACGLLASLPARSQAVLASPRIVHAIDESNLVTLKGNVHPGANAGNDRGPVSADLPMTDLILVLSRSPEQQAAFSKFVASQYDPESANFHHWLKPAEVGADFGPSQTDIATLTNWLIGRGFSVDQVGNDRMTIRFSGSAAQVESAFHTEIHNLEVKGVAHIGNMSDPQIPAALAPAVVGIKALHNFFPHPLHRLGSKVSKDSATGKWMRASKAPVGAESGSSSSSTARNAAKPEFGIDDTTNGYQVEDVTPYDFATIYNLLPLWNASSPIDGTGQTIAIAGTSAIVESDIDTFRSSFGLPAYTSANLPTNISGNSQALTVCSNSTTLCTINDLIENTLDVEWSGAVAKGANIVLVSSYPSSSSDDNLYDSESYIVNNQIASIMNVSYGLCELGNGTAGNVQYYNLWQTAATEGIAVFVAAGDGGAAECDDGGDSAGNPYSAQYGLSVNGLASTPYNTAVGGTDFNWCSPSSTTACPPAPYWNSTNAANGSSAIGYVPEVPWNDTCVNPLTVALLEQWATSTYAGNVGGVTDPESGCNFVFKNWSAVETASGGTNLSHFIDTVGGGGGASGCVANDGSTVASCTASTTTTGTANGSIPLASDGWPKPAWQTGVSGIPADGVRDLPDVSFFASDGFLSYSSYLICVSEVADCTYTTGTEPTSQEVGGTSVSSPAMAGVMALINQKAGESQGNPNAELYKLAAKQTYSSCSAESGKTTNGCSFNDIDSGNNATPCDYGADEGDPATAGIVSPNCTISVKTDTVGILNGYSAAVGYDQTTGLGSLNVANVVNAWPVSTATSKATVTLTPSKTSISAGSALTIAVAVAASSSGGATPTGKVTLIGGDYTSGAVALSSGAYSFTVPANSLSAGSDVFTVSYSGDSTYAQATGTTTVAVTAVVGTGTATVAVTPAATTLTTSTALSVAVTVTGSGATPTGTVTLSGGGYTSTAEPLASGSYTFTIPANSLTAGSDTLTVTYAGDTTYASATGTASVTVTSSTSTTGTFALAASATSAVSPGSPGSSTITVTGSGGYTGTANLTCALTSSPSGAVDLPACTLSPTSVALSTTTTSGSVTATVTTTAATTAQLIAPRRPIGRTPSGTWTGGAWTRGGAMLALVLFFGIPARRRSWRNLLGAFLLIAALGGLSACGDFWQAPGGNTANGTTAGSYTFTVTGTGSPAVSSAVTTTFTLTVN
jgi:hypothetical protein